MPQAPSARYHFSVEGYSFGLLDSLSRSFSFHSCDVQFFRDELDGLAPKVFFRSPHLNRLTDIDKVWARGKQLMTLFNGAYQLSELACHDPNPVQLPLLRELYDFQRGINTTALYATTALKPQVSDFDPTELGNTPLIVPNGSTAYAVYLSRTHEDVRKLLSGMGLELTYSRLFSICDTLAFSINEKRRVKGVKTQKQHMPIQELYSAAGTDHPEYTRFSSTANNYRTLGDDARHGLTADRPPANPMSLDDSRYLIASLVRAYLTKYHDIHYCSPRDFSLESSSFIDDDF